MEILITGGTGLIGQQLCPSLIAQGHVVTVLSRTPAAVAKKCGVQVRPLGSLEEWTDAVHFDAVINLAGAPIVDATWSPARKQLLRDSRIALTQALVARIGTVQRKPAVLLSGSAIGYYGTHGDVPFSESTAPGSDFAAQLCVDWEAAAQLAENFGVRVCQLRTGLVLSARGGMLQRMLLPFRLGVGARLGDGKQSMSWVHIDDHVAMMMHLLGDASCRGAYNLTAPHAVSNREFTHTLAEVLQRPAWFVAPAGILRLAMGERADLLLAGQCVVPQRMTDAGFVFRYPELRTALENLLTR